MDGCSGLRECDRKLPEWTANRSQPGRWFVGSQKHRKDATGGRRDDGPSYRRGIARPDRQYAARPRAWRTESRLHIVPRRRSRRDRVHTWKRPLSTVPAEPSGSTDPFASRWRYRPAVSTEAEIRGSRPPMPPQTLAVLVELLAWSSRYLWQSMHARSLLCTE